MRTKMSEDELREAIREQSRVYRQANREAIIERKRVYRRANSEALREQGRVHRQANREAINERQRDHYQANREAINEQQRGWWIAGQARSRRTIDRQALTASRATLGGTKWTTAEDAALANMGHQGLSRMEVALALGRTLSSVDTRRSRLRARGAL